MLTINKFSSNSIRRIRILEACDLTDGTHWPSKIVRAFFAGFAIESVNSENFSYKISDLKTLTSCLKIF